MKPNKSRIFQTAWAKVRVISEHYDRTFNPLSAATKRRMFATYLREPWAQEQEVIAAAKVVRLDVRRAPSSPTQFKIAA